MGSQPCGIKRNSSVTRHILRGDQDDHPLTLKSDVDTDLLMESSVTKICSITRAARPSRSFWGWSKPAHYTINQDCHPILGLPIWRRYRWGHLFLSFPASQKRRDTGQIRNNQQAAFLEIQCPEVLTVWTFDSKMRFPWWRPWSFDIITISRKEVSWNKLVPIYT